MGYAIVFLCILLGLLSVCIPRIRRRVIVEEPKKTSQRRRPGAKSRRPVRPA